MMVEAKNDGAGMRFLGKPEGAGAGGDFPEDA